MLGNLVPAAPLGLSRSIAFTNAMNADRGAEASLEEPIFVNWWARNEGRVSIREPFNVALFIDGEHANTWRADDAPLNRLFSVTNASWGESFPSLEQGEHVLEIVLDSDDEIEEINEDDNVYRLTVTVTAPVGPTPTPTPEPVLAQAPEPLGKPNLKPYWRFGWGDPITVSRNVNRRTNDIMVVNRGGYIRASVWNESLIGAAPFEVDLYFDGNKVETWKLPNVPGGYLITPGSDSIIEELDPRSGSHTLKMVIDPRNQVDETNEEDNVFETTVFWHQTEPAPEQSISYTDAEIAEAFSGIELYIDEWQTVLGEERQAVALSMADAGYYLITGMSIHDEPVVIEMLNEEDYRAKVDELFLVEFATSPTRLYPDILDRRERFKNTVVGYTTSHLGKVLVVVNTERPFANVLRTLAHEFGHARQRIKAPHQNSVARSHAVRGMFEAEAFLFARVFQLTVEEWLGIRLAEFSADLQHRERIDSYLEYFKEGASEDEHDLGALLVWAMLFADGVVQDLEDSFVENGALNAEEALRLYNHFIANELILFELYVDLRVQEFDEVIQRIRTAALSRLELALPLAGEGEPGLFMTDVLLP